MPTTNPAGTNEEEEEVLQQPILHLHRPIHQVTILWRHLHKAILLQRHLKHRHQQIAIKSHLWATSNSQKRLVICNHHLHKASHQHQLLLQLLLQPPHQGLHHHWQGVASPIKTALPLTLFARSGTSASVRLTNPEE